MNMNENRVDASLLTEEEHRTLKPLLVCKVPSAATWKLPARV